MKSLGVGLVLFLYALVILMFYSCAYDLVYTYHMYYKNTILSFILLSIGLFATFNILYNFTMATFLSPGTIDLVDLTENNNNNDP